jgi:hypothetical protein
MAESAWRTYTLTADESSRWQRGGVAALALQHQLAELHRQGSLGLEPRLEVFHPDGILAAQHQLPLPQDTTPLPKEAATLLTQEPASGLAQASQTAQTPAMSRVEGTLYTTPRVTAYQMSARASAAWSRGGAEARAVEAAIGDALQDFAPSQGVPVLLDDGRAMYTYGGSAMQEVTSALSLLWDRARQLAPSFDMQFDVSLHLGTHDGTPRSELAQLGRRLAQLAQAQGTVHSRQAEQGMGMA